LTGGFQKDAEYHDMRRVLDRLLADQPLLESELECARGTLGECKHWLKALPDDVTLQPVPMPASDGVDLDAVRASIGKAEEEIAELRAVPVPSSDIRERLQDFVAGLARPRITGIGNGEPLRVIWPADTIAALALLLPEQMTAALLKEIDRLANSPMTLQARNRRISELKSEIDTLQRQALAAGEDTSGLPPEVVLGVRVVRREQARRMESSERAA
jgi:hypothetical protein